MLVTSDVPMEGGGFYSRQSGQANVKGIELDIQGEIAPGLGIVLNYAYTDAKISKDSDPTVVGNRLPGTARHIQNTWLNYRIPTGKLAGLKISAGYQYQVKRVAGLVYDKQEYPLADYFRLDAALGYSINRFDINLNVNNLLDKYLYVGGKSGSYYWWQTEPGRNFRLGLGYRF
ncbi:iron complex outermembrane recepter protein [bacterium A37T11]|nr:iron complex outermembrane recepter protein [bacterium A37T11]